MELEELVISLKELKESENLKIYGYLANSEAKDEIFENGLYLLSKRCNALFFKLDDEFYENPVDYIESEVGTSTLYGFDTLYIVATSQKKLSMLLRRDPQMDENGNRLRKISPTNVVGSLDLNDYYFEQNNESALRLEKPYVPSIKK